MVAEPVRDRVDTRRENGANSRPVNTDFAGDGGSKKILKTGRAASRSPWRFLRAKHETRAEETPALRIPGISISDEIYDREQVPNWADGRSDTTAVPAGDESDARRKNVGVSRPATIDFDWDRGSKKSRKTGRVVGQTQRPLPWARSEAHAKHMSTFRAPEIMVLYAIEARKKASGRGGRTARHHGGFCAREVRPASNKCRHFAPRKYRL